MKAMNLKSIRILTLVMGSMIILSSICITAALADTKTANTDLGIETAETHVGYTWGWITIQGVPTPVPVVYPSLWSDSKSRFNPTGSPLDIQNIGIRSRIWVNGNLNYDSTPINNANSADAVGNWVAPYWLLPGDHKTLSASASHTFYSPGSRLNPTWNPNTSDYSS